MGGDHHTSSVSASDGSPTAEAMPSAWSSASRSSDISRALSRSVTLCSPSTVRVGETKRWHGT